MPTLLSSNQNDNISKFNSTSEGDPKRLEESISSFVALLILLALIITLLSTSLATFHFHKWKLKSKKLQRAQEEYERDQGNSKLQHST